MKIIKKIFLLLFLAFLALSLMALGYYFAVTKGVTLSPEKLLFSEKNVTLYDDFEEPVRGVSFHFSQQTTSIREIPEHTKRAFVDVEDKRFYKHGGYDVKGILRATLHNLRSHSFKEGASTISQQLIKNTHLSQEKTVKRKLKEWKLTRELEKQYTKEEILERYLNTIYFGHSCFGITFASEYYFNKKPSELTLADSAILAGLVKSPNYYSPFKNPDACRRRQNVVLTVMEKNGSITVHEKASALRIALPQAPTTREHTDYAHFVFDELTALSEKEGFTLGGKIQIHTYLQPELQKKVEEIANGYTASDKTLLVLDGKSRGFKACVSTVGNIPRLPGSLLKPLLVYAPALEENILAPATPILDAKINYGGYSPENFDGAYHGYVSARECVERSLNIPAVKTLETLTIEKGTTYLEQMGLPVSKEDKSLALALGGMKKGYPLKDILAAYSCLQNGGVYSPCGFIKRIQIDSQTVYEKKASPRQVFHEESAYLMTDILKTTAERGTAKKLRTLPFAIAAKTGTSGTKAGNTDAYALAYTPLDCAAVWIGNADNSFVDTTGGGSPCSLLYQIHQALQERYEKKGRRIPPFPSNNRVKSVELDKSSYYDTHTLVLADELSPKEYRFTELFKTSSIPLNKSTSFTSPSIPMPHITIMRDIVDITFDKHCPTYYTYKIERTESGKKITLYNGEYLPSFQDKDLLSDKTYVYTVTPFYKERAGKTITLPIVTTKNAGTSLNNQEILSKEWWED